ncbi:hypothetical protein T484DRAFT_2016317, partial [Baffinella frigidus]
MRLRALAGAILLLLAGSAALPQTPHGSTVPVPCPSGFGGTLANLVPQFQPDLRARRSGGPPKGGASLVTTVLQSLLRFLGVVLQPLAFIIEPMVALSRAGDRVDVDPQSQTPVAMHKNKREPPWHDFVVPTAPRDLDLVVPSWRFENVKDAVEIARNGQRVYAKAGDHHWDAKITIHGSSDRKPARGLTVEGESGARLWGRWSVSRFSQGTIRGVMCAYETEGVAWPCVINRGDPWLFDHCQIRSAGTYAVMCAKTSSTTLRRCGLGGMGSGSRRAINAVIIMDSSWCLLQCCQIEDTENTHPGVRLMENAGGRLENCTLQRNGYGVAVDNNAQVDIIGCTMRDHDHAALFAGWEAANAAMDIRRCTAYGRVWHTNDRPGTLSECDNRFTVSAMQEAFEDEGNMMGMPGEDPSDLQLSWRQAFGGGGYPTADTPRKEAPPRRRPARQMSFPNLRDLDAAAPRSSSLASEGSFGANLGPAGGGDARPLL